MKLSAHFTLEELTASQTAARMGIDNTPPRALMDNLKFLAMRLEEIRVILDGKPLFITSGYRCPQVNAAVGGDPESAHTLGLAADFICPRFGGPFDVCKRIAESDVPFDQLIHEYGEWAHVAFFRLGTSTRPRRQVLSKFHATPYIKGLYANASLRTVA